jgi:hypothetical protein
MTIFESSQSI